MHYSHNRKGACLPSLFKKVKTEDDNLTRVCKVLFVVKQVCRARPKLLYQLSTAKIG